LRVHSAGNLRERGRTIAKSGKPSSTAWHENRGSQGNGPKLPYVESTTWICFRRDKYDFKPTTPQRTFAEQLLHASGVNYYFTNIVLGEKPPATENPPRDQFKSKAEIAAYVKKAFADGAAAIQKRGDKGMSELIVDPYSNQQTRIGDYAYGFIEHSGEHYGQLVVYYRVAGLVPPESRPKK